MKKMIRRVILAAIMFMAFPLTASAQGESDITQYLDQKLEEMISQKEAKGAIVTVVSEGTNGLNKGYGYADEENGIEAHEDSIAFHIGSISKTFVAIAAQQLVQDGELDMNASISDYIETDFIKLKYDITMKQLLTYTAGFEDMISGIVVDNLNKTEPLEVSIQKCVPNQVFIPGEVVSYSNYGIALAAYVVQCITGQDFDQYAQENIFTPLNMSKTSFKLDFKGVEVSKAYTMYGNETTELIINLYPEGSVVSTATDMSKYIIWLMDASDRVLSANNKQQLFEQQYTMSEEFEGVGYTWSRQERNGEVYYTKKGETNNFYSRIVIYPKQNTGIFISFNNYVAEEKLNLIINEVTNRLLGYEEEQSPYLGEQTADMSGYYVTTRSSFENQEKAMNFLMPNRVFRVTGSREKGFFLGGKELIPIGENYYKTSMGNMKFIEKEGRVYLANSTPTSYVRTSWYESNTVQMLIVGFFVLTSLIMAVIGIIILFQKNAGRKKELIISVLALLNITLLIAMCALIYKGISTFSFLGIGIYVWLCGILITITGIGGVIYTVNLCYKNIISFNKIALVAWNISSILFCIWMRQVNIL